jgi:uncharacterized protein
MFRKIMLVAIIAALAAESHGALIITGIIDGGRTGGLPKALELYATTNIADLSVYAIDNANNGGAFDGTTIPLSGSATAGSFLYVASEIPGFNAYFGFNPNFTGSSLNVNGDDVVGLFQSAVLVDVFGVLGLDGTGQPWEYLDGYAYRISGTGPSATFTLSDWTFSGIDATDAFANTAPPGFAIGTYTATAVPEPSSMALIGLVGVAGLAVRYRRKNASSSVAV